MMMTMISQPLLLHFSASLVAWTASYIYCYKNLGGKNAFANCLVLHDAHCVVVVVLGLASIVINDDAYLSEGVAIFFSIAYFVVDLFDCVVRKDVPFFIHSVVSIVIAAKGYFDPALRGARLASRGFLIELSSPQLHVWQRSKKKVDFVAFFLLFTACRIVWIPLVLIRVIDAIGHKNIGVLTIVLLYVLQLGWWFKMIPMLLNYKEKTVRTEMEDENKSGNTKEKRG
mmetsp:Transcript_4263/g.8999  ORF Transcript_4263/g.8999 Transcript_4263/m.8999 type:complete len:228 (-) Transcript_4263:96-779(-)